MNQQSMQIKSAPLLSLSYGYSKQLLRSIVKLVFRKDKRNSSKVSFSYHSGSWRAIKKKKEWLKYDNLLDYVIGDNVSTRLAKIDSKCVFVNTKYYYEKRLHEFSKIIEEYANTQSTITELGCGYGYNLFSLYATGKWAQLTGFDISENAIESAKEIAAHFKIGDSVRFGNIDLTDVRNENFEKISGSTVFTYFCIEQIPYAVEKVVDNIIAHRPKRVINIEPTTEMLKIWKPLDFLNFVYVKSMDYQTRLFNVLANLEKEGKVRIIAKDRLGYAPTIHNDGFIVVWEPVY